MTVSYDGFGMKLLAAKKSNNIRLQDANDPQEDCRPGRLCRQESLRSLHNYVSIGLPGDDAVKLVTAICPKGLSYLSRHRKRACHGTSFSTGHLAGKTNPNGVST
jgi:hypothetical protein